VLGVALKISKSPTQHLYNPRIHITNDAKVHQQTMIE
jgi:hypothetical protein